MLTPNKQSTLFDLLELAEVIFSGMLEFLVLEQEYGDSLTICSSSST